MSRVAFVDNSGSLHSVVWTVQEEGHDILYLIDGKEGNKIGEGLVPRASNLREVIEWHPSAIVLYNVPHLVSKLSKIPSFGSSPTMSRLESDRMYAISVVRQTGAGVAPKTLSFHGVKEARDFINEDHSRSQWVFKATGSDVGVSTTHVTDDKDHLLEVLSYEEGRGSKDFVLQERIDGVEISIEGWFDYRHGWLLPINSTLERKKLMPGDVGPISGCMGSIVWAWGGERPLLFRQTLEKLTSYLKDREYVGPVDGNYIIDYKSRRPYFLEFTPRLGWNAFEAVMSGMTQSIGEFLERLAKGEVTKFPLNEEGYLGAVRLYCPASPDIPVAAPLREDRRLYPKDLWSLDDRLFTVGDEALNGLTVIMEAAARGDTIKQVMSELYDEVVPQVRAPDLLYRNDIGEKALEDISMLKAWGYVVDGSH